MDGMVVINNRGSYIKKGKEELCKVLVKKATAIWYSSRPRKFNTDIDSFLVYLNQASEIQIYKTGVVRMFLKRGQFEEKRSVFIYKLPREVLEILCE